MNRTVYVPLPSEPVFDLIARGSGIVSPMEPRDDARTYAPTGPTMVWFEGNIYKAANIVTFGDRVLHAADRMDHNYPTRAHVTAPRGSLLAVARWTGHGVSPFDALGEVVLNWWLEGEFDMIDAAELAATTRIPHIPPRA